MATTSRVDAALLTALEGVVALNRACSDPGPSPTSQLHETVTAKLTRIGVTL